MAFTVHPKQKPSDDETIWNNALAVSLCKLHAENVRVKIALEKALEAEKAG